MSTSKYDALPDIQTSSAILPIDIPKVGISNFKAPVSWYPVTSCCDKLETNFSCYINCQKELKGISMSRLPRSISKVFQKYNSFNSKMFFEVLHEAYKEEKPLSFYLKRKAYIPVFRKSLVSENGAWKYYPVTIESKKTDDQKISNYFTFEINYSSACPCSFELSKYCETLYNEAAIAHSQRSIATITFKIRDISAEPVLTYFIESFINDIETEVLKTPTQVIVQREDEMEFARLNGLNPKFVEDSVRLIANYLDENKRGIFEDYVVVCKHMESLHDFDVIAIKYKGLTGGLR